VRKTKLFGALAVVLIVTVMVLPRVVSADQYFKIETHSDAYSLMGKEQPAATDTMVTWIGKNALRADNGDTASILILNDDEKFVILNHTKKTFVELPFDIVGNVEMLIDMQSESKEQAEQMKQAMEGMMSMMQVNMEVIPTEEKAEKAGYDCQKYTVKMKMGQLTSEEEIWATEEIDTDYSMYRKSRNIMQLALPGMKEALVELQKIKGFPVMTMTTTDMMGTPIKRNYMLLEFKDTDPPRGAYQVPEGYTEGDPALLGPMGR